MIVAGPTVVVVHTYCEWTAPDAASVVVVNVSPVCVWAAAGAEDRASATLVHDSVQRQTACR